MLSTPTCAVYLVTRDVQRFPGYIKKQTWWKRSRVGLVEYSAIMGCLFFIRENIRSLAKKHRGEKDPEISIFERAAVGRGRVRSPLRRAARPLSCLRILSRSVTSDRRI